MLPKGNLAKVLELFFIDPMYEYQLREIGRNIGLAPKSVKTYLDLLLERGLVSKSMFKKYPVYHANRDNQKFRRLKRTAMLSALEDCGLVDYLQEKCMPDSIILFGSADKGEDMRESDVDIYMQSGKTELSLLKFEKALKRRISLFFEEDFDSLSNGLKLNIVNGARLRGFLKVKEWMD